MTEQPVLRVLAKFLMPFILVFGFYVITHGELGPGGGFQGGVILASAFILYALVFGLPRLHEALPAPVVDTLVAAGLLLYIGVGVISLFRGRRFLDYEALDFLSKKPGYAEAWGMTLVEYGVGITVAAVMITIFSKIAGKKD